MAANKTQALDASVESYLEAIPEAPGQGNEGKAPDVGCRHGGFRQYIRSLADLDVKVLESLVAASIADIHRHPQT